MTKKKKISTRKKNVPTLLGPVKNETEADQIIAFLHGKVTAIAAPLRKKLLRYEFAYDQRRLYKRKADIVQMIEHKFSVSRQQAYRDINESEFIFGKSENSSKAFHRNLLLEMSMKNIEIAMKSKDSEVITKALLAHAKISGVDKEDPDLPDFSKMEQHNYFIQMPIEYQEFLKNNIFRKGAVNLDELMPNKPKFIEIGNGSK